MHTYSSPLSVCLSYNMLAVIVGRYRTGLPADNMFRWQIKRRIIEGNPWCVCVIRCIQTHPRPPTPHPQGLSTMIASDSEEFTETCYNPWLQRKNDFSKVDPPSRGGCQAPLTRQMSSAAEKVLELQDEACSFPSKAGGQSPKNPKKSPSSMSDLSQASLQRQQPTEQPWKWMRNGTFLFMSTFCYGHNTAVLSQVCI